MSTQISPMLAVSDGNKAIDFYKKAFGAEELWRLESGAHVVACLSINGAELFLANEIIHWLVNVHSSECCKAALSIRMVIHGKLVRY